MIYYKNYDFDNKDFTYINVSRKGSWCDNIFTFDIETTNCFVKDGVAINFDYSKDNNYYKQFEKCGFMYIWQFGIDTDCVYGRTWSEFIEFITMLHEKVGTNYICYVHNLSFEMQFLFNVFDDLEIFARKTHKPMKAYTEKYGIEFRCSYILTQLSLESCAKNFKLPVQKKTGDLDYNKLRNSKTVLSEVELGYCEFDILVTYYIVLRYKNKYRNVYNIPLTQTGEVRRPVKALYKKDNKYFKYISNCQPRSLEEFNMLLSAFWGGYTHGNAIHNMDIFNGLHSHDFTSDYPAKMVAKKFPSTFFWRIRSDCLNRYGDNYAKLLYVKLWGLKSRYHNNFLSTSKCIKKSRVLEDNGRIDTADYIEIILTDVDFKIMLDTYDIECILYKDIRVSEYKYLDYKYIDYTLTLYSNKTVYKGVEEEEELYMASKQFLNSLYGMQVTCPINDNVIYTDDWEVIPMTTEEKEDKIKSLSKSRKNFLSYSHGVWVTAWARAELWHMITMIDNDVVYCDTDSIKSQGNHEILFKRHNLKIASELFNSVFINELDINKLRPTDTKGITHLLGIWDNEGDYKRFLFMGAKKYAYEDIKNSDIHITVSGVSKKGAVALNKLEDFAEGFTFDYYKSGKMTVFYNDNQSEFVITDDNGVSEVSNVKHGTCLEPTTYTLSKSVTYDDYIDAVASIEHEI